MKNKKITLESTATAFHKWRETKRNAGDPIPQELWQMVAEIYDHYPHTVICSTLNLKVAQLKTKGIVPNSRTCANETTEEEATPSPFVHVPPTGVNWKNRQIGSFFIVYGISASNLRK